jgi:hypothetical protein
VAGFPVSNGVPEPGFRTGGHGFGGAVGRDALPIDVEVSAKRETA